MNQFNLRSSDTSSALLRGSSLGISLSSWASRASIDVLNDLGNRRVETRILTMDPDNPALEYIINEELILENLAECRNKVASMAEFFTDMTEKFPTFETRVMKRGLPHNQIIITDHTNLVLQYMFSRGTDESPLLQFPHDTELYNVYLEEFEDLWKLNKPK